MSTTYPTTKDTFINPNPTDLRTGVTSASVIVSKNNDATLALETKVGIDGSLDATSIDYKLSGIPALDKASSITGTENLINKTLSTPVITSIYQDAGKTKLMSLPNTTSDEIVTKEATQSFKNKTLTDSTNNVQANSLKSATTSIDVSASVAPISGQALIATDPTHATWQTFNVITDDLIKVATVSLSSAQILSLKTPVELIPAPGAGKIIIVDEVILSYTNGGTSYTGGNTLDFKYDGNVTSCGLSGISGSAITGASIIIRQYVYSTSTDITSAVNKNLAISVYSGGSNFATGNGTAKVTVVYRIITL